MSQRKRINRTERRQILRCLGKLTLAVVALVALVDGATPDEIVHALEILDELVTTFRRAVRTIEPADDAPDGY